MEAALGHPGRSTWSPGGAADVFSAPPLASGCIARDLFNLRRPFLRDWPAPRADGHPRLFFVLSASPPLLVGTATQPGAQVSPPWREQRGQRPAAAGRALPQVGGGPWRLSPGLMLVGPPRPVGTRSSFVGRLRAADRALTAGPAGRSGVRRPLANVDLRRRPCPGAVARACRSSRRFTCRGPPTRAWVLRHRQTAEGLQPVFPGQHNNPSTSARTGPTHCAHCEYNRTIITKPQR